MIDAFHGPSEALNALRMIRERLEQGHQFDPTTGNAAKWTRMAIREAETIKAMLPSPVEEYENAAKGGS